MANVVYAHLYIIVLYIYIEISLVTVCFSIETQNLNLGFWVELWTSTDFTANFWKHDGSLQTY